jgi:hypothetical protein
MAETPGASSGTRITPEHPAVTRHGPQSPHAGISSSRPMPRCVAVVTVGTKGPAICHGDLLMLISPGEESPLAKPSPAHRTAGAPVTTTRLNTKSP